MASELAHVAVKNESWHHTAASRALADQLCPRRRSSMVSTVSSSDKARRSFHKAVSSVELSDHSRSEEDDLDLDSDGSSPDMVRSSASDTSSLNGDAPDDPEDCEEWAASLIADLAVDPPVTRPSRSPSVSSDEASNEGSLSSSPKGFWTVRPGSNQAVCDDGSISWSPKTSSRGSLDDDMEGLEAPELMIDGKENDAADVKTPTVTFADEQQAFVPPATVNVTSFMTSSEQNFDAKKKDNGGMIRSKSYTALSATTGRAKKTVGSSRRGSDLSQDYDNYKKYFHKFIDLVIVRETTAALHHSRHGVQHRLT